MLQADSQRECAFWIDAINRKINNALNSDMEESGVSHNTSVMNDSNYSYKDDNCSFTSFAMANNESKNFDNTSNLSGLSGTNNGSPVVKTNADPAKSTRSNKSQKNKLVLVNPQV